MEFLDSILDPLTPESTIAAQTGQHDSHIDRQMAIREGMNPADSAAALYEEIVPVKPSVKVYLLTDPELIDTVNLDAESSKTHIASLAPEGMDVTRLPYTLTADQKFQRNAFITPSFRKFDCHLCSPPLHQFLEITKLY